MHHLGLDLYYKREFEKAASCFSQVAKFLPDDRLSRSFLERCGLYRKTPPSLEWSGVVSIKAK